MLTFDYRLAFAGYMIIATVPARKISSPGPYAAWQRGSNENYNGLLRQFFRKRSYSRKLTATRAVVVQDLIIH